MSSFFSFSTGAGLTTDRLALRAWLPDEIAAVGGGDRRADWAADFPADGDVVIAGVIAGQPGEPGANGHLVIVERGSGLVVGSLSLLWPPADGGIEFGYGVVASRRGLGYATEAARAVVASALRTPGIDTVHAEVDLANPASVRVLEKVGMRRVDDDGVTARYSTR